MTRPNNTITVAKCTQRAAAVTVATCTQRVAAVEQYVPKKGTIPVHSEQYTQQQVEAIYQACIDARQTLVNLRGQVTAALAAKTEADATMTAFDDGLEAWVATTFGPASQAAIDFGYAKKAPQKPSVQTKVEAQAKAKATRIARGTKGPKAKLKITGGTTPAASASQPAAPEATTPTPATPAVAPKS